MSPPLDLRIVEVVQQLSLCREAEAIVRVLRDAARALTGADGATIILREGDFCHYAEENAIAPLWKGKRFPIDSCISGICMKTRRQIALEDIYADGRIPHDLYRATFVHSLVVTPIRSMDPLGAIGAYWQARHAATAQELATLQALADSAAVAFENASLIASLTSVNRRKDEFMVMLAHELRNPLAPARNAVHLLRATDGLDSRGAWAVDVLDRQLDQLTCLTDELLETSRIVSGKVRLQRSRLDLTAFMRDVISDHRAAAIAADVSLHDSLPAAPLWIDADATRLRQVVMSVLDNAMKFTPGGGKVEVTLVAEDGKAVVRVRDSGVGIDPAFLPHVFESFAQEDDSLERTRGGLGLGLTIARSLAQAQDGELEVASEGMGRGTQATLRLPLAAEPAAITANTGAPHAACAARPLRVLVVEDNADAADSLQMLLEMVGHEVSVSRDGPSGVDAARAERPDVVLCDIGLPGFDGYQVARTLRADSATAHARLVAITGYGGEDARGRALDAGFDEHLTKPVAPRTLLEKLQTAPALTA